MHKFIAFLYLLFLIKKINLAYPLEDITLHVYNLILREKKTRENFQVV